MSVIIETRKKSIKLKKKTAIFKEIKKKKKKRKVIK